MSRITVLLAEDHKAVREGLRSLLELEQDLTVIGEAEDGLQAVSMSARLTPDVVVMDISMPQLNGLEAMRQILKARPATRVLVLSAQSDQAYIERAEALGASGYVSKQADPNRLPEAIRKAHQGLPFFAPGLPEGAGRAFHKPAAMPATHSFSDENH